MRRDFSRAAAVLLRVSSIAPCAPALNSAVSTALCSTLDSMLTSTNPDIRRLLGVEGDMGKSLAIDNKWAYNIIKQVGNFGETWDRNITVLGVPRGINNIWTKGGLHYAPPIR